MIRELCRKNSLFNDPVINKQTVKELDLIENTDYEEYYEYLLEYKIKVSNDVNSWVAYLLGITSQEPKGGWKIDRKKSTLPDIDIDFEDERRPEIKEYLHKRWGENNVADISTISRLKPKAVLKAVGKVFGVNDFEITKLNKNFDNLIKAFGNEFETIPECIEFKNKYPEVVKHCFRIQGAVRHLSTNAAGVIISKDVLGDNIPMCRVRDKLVIGFEASDMESIGYTKFDVLGVKNLTIIKNILEFLRNKGIEIDLNFINLEDKKVYKTLAKGNTAGIFQFESENAKNMCRLIQPDCFEDIVAINAMNRPGPLSDGTHKKYAANKKAGKIIEYSSPYLLEILKSTLGLCIYQESVSDILYKAGNMNWIQVSRCKQMVAKSEGSEALEVYRKVFIDGAIKNKIPYQDADNIFNMIREFGRYGFKRVHSVAYSLIAYYALYLKTYYPLVFMNFLLNNAKKNGKDKKQNKYLDELRRLDIKVSAPTINESPIKFKIHEDSIMYGFEKVEGVGVKAAESIIAGQPYKSLEDFLSRVDLKVVNKRVIKSLSIIGAFKGFDYGNRAIYQSFDLLTKNFKKNEKIKEQILELKSKATKENKEKIIEKIKLAMTKRVPLLGNGIEKDAEWDKNHLKDIWLEKLGIPIVGKMPLEYYDHLLKNLNVRLISLENFSTIKKYGCCYLAGIITSTTEKKAILNNYEGYNVGEKFLQFTLDDGSGFEIKNTTTPKLYLKYKEDLKVGNVVIIDGQKANDFVCLVKDISNLRRVEKNKDLTNFDKALFFHPVKKWREFYKDRDRLVSSFANKVKSYDLLIGLVRNTHRFEREFKPMCYITIGDEMDTKEILAVGNCANVYFRDLKHGDVIAVKPKLKDDRLFMDSEDNKCLLKILEKGDTDGKTEIKRSN